MKTLGTKIYLTPELKQEVSHYCYKNSTQLSKVVRDLLTEWVAQQDNKLEPPIVELGVDELPPYPPQYLINK
jgi:hypothetical protein